MRFGAYSYIRNGISRGYPFIEAFSVWRGFVDEFVIVDGFSDDGTWEFLQRLAGTWPELRLLRREPHYLHAPTDPKGLLLGEIFETARQALQTRWQVMVQADCVFFPLTVAALRLATASVPEGVAALVVQRNQFRWNWQERYSRSHLKLCTHRERARVDGDALDTQTDGLIDLRLLPLFSEMPVADCSWCFWENLPAKVAGLGEIWPDKKHDHETGKFAWYDEVTGRDFSQDMTAFKEHSSIPALFCRDSSPYQRSLPAILHPLFGTTVYDPEQSLRNLQSQGPCDVRSLLDGLANPSWTTPVLTAKEAETVAYRP